MSCSGSVDFHSGGVPAAGEGGRRTGGPAGKPGLVTSERKKNTAPCEKEGTFRDCLLLRGGQLTQLCDCVALWPWGGLGRGVTAWAGGGGQARAAG